MKKRSITRTFLMTAIFLIVPLFIFSQSIFAGDSGSQSGRLTRNDNVYGRNPAEIAKQEQQFAAAQMKNSQNQPPSADGQTGEDSSLRSSVSYFASVFFLLGGLWLLVSLMRERWLKRFAPQSVRLAKVWNFALKPQFALSVFALLFAATIIGSALTSPTKTTAQNKKKTSRTERKNDSSNAVATVNSPVFASAQQIGGDGVTQIGAPVFDFDGNRYVRGTFSGTLTIGATTLTASYDLDMFIAKYDADGNPLWARQGFGQLGAPAPGLAVEGATALTVYEGRDEADNPVEFVYVAGSFARTLTLQGGNNPPITLTDGGGAGYNYEAFLAKYDKDGNLLWARGGNSGSPKNPDNNETGQNAINKIVFDSFGRIYLTGFISGNTFLGASVSDFTCSNNQACALHGKTDIIIAALDPATGAPTKMNVLGGTGDDNGLDVAIDNVTNPNDPQFYLVANFSSPEIVLPNGPFSNNTYTNPSGAINTFVLNFRLGTFSFDGIWNKVLQNNGTVGANKIVTNAAGQAIISGYFTGTISAPGNPNLTLTNDRTGTGEAALAGFVAMLDITDGSFVLMTKLPGVANDVVIQNDRLLVVGTLYDTGTSYDENGNAISVDTLGASDLYVANVNLGNFGVEWIKTAAGTGYEGSVAAGNPTAADGATKNYYTPLAIASYNGRIFISGDFKGTLSLDCITLKTPGASRQTYIAELSFEPTTCRIWTNTNSSQRNWDDNQNWNGGVVPSSGDSVYVPYRKDALYDPIYNPANNVSLTGLSINNNQTLLLQQNLAVNEQLDLLGGKIDAGTNQVNLGFFANAYSISGGRVIGKLQKFFFGQSDFTFPVGTSNGYSPVTLSNYNAGKGGTFAVTANQGTYPNQADGLPMNRANRWWNLTNNGLQRADLTFQYLPGDITAGIENQYRTYRIPAGGGTASMVDSTIDTTAKTVFVPNVSEFSDWTFAQPLAPTAATVSVGGRVMTPDGVGVSQARILMTDSAGNTRQVTTNSFGYYRFDRVQSGATYVFTVSHKRFGTASMTQIQNIQEERDDLDFITPR